MSKNLKIFGAIAAVLLVIGVGYYILSPRNSVKAVTNGSTSSVSGGWWVQASNSGDTLTVGTSTQWSVSNTNYAVTDNGVTTTYFRAASVSGTSTPCAVQSPAATSTIGGFTFMPTVGTSTSATLTLATSTTAFATSSLMYTNVAYTPTGAFTWEGGPNNTVIYPSTWIVMGLASTIANGGAGQFGFVMSGVCIANFTSIN